MKSTLLLIDTNLFLDLFMNRIDFIDNSAKIIRACIEGLFEGIISAHSVTNMYYILRKNCDESLRRKFLLDLLENFKIEVLDVVKLKSALKRSNFLDFEDCLQDECAISSKADFIITRNKDDYRTSTVPALTPEEFIKIMKL